MKILIRNESEEDVKIISKKGSIHEYTYVVKPGSSLAVSQEVFDTLYLSPHMIKIDGGCIKLRDKKYE